jgi:hypothetical protein
LSFRCFFSQELDSAEQLDPLRRAKIPNGREQSAYRKQVTVT